MRLFSRILFAFLVLLLSFPKTASAKSFSFPKVSVDIYVQADSSIKIKELRTFYFDGSFSKIYWDIPLKSSQDIRDVTVEENAPSVVNYSEIPSPDDSRPVHKY